MSRIAAARLLLGLGALVAPMAQAASSAWAGLPVLHNGRVMPMDSHARQILPQRLIPADEVREISQIVFIRAVGIGRQRFGEMQQALVSLIGNGQGHSRMNKIPGRQVTHDLP